MFEKYYIANFNISMYAYDVHKMVILQRSFNDSTNLLYIKEEKELLKYQRNTSMVKKSNQIIDYVTNNYIHNNRNHTIDKIATTLGYT